MRLKKTEEYINALMKGWLGLDLAKYKVQRMAMILRARPKTSILLRQTGSLAPMLRLKMTKKLLLWKRILHLKAALASTSGGSNQRLDQVKNTKDIEAVTRIDIHPSMTAV
jgi:hypothetical protein